MIGCRKGSGRLNTLTYGGGVALAALTGVLAAPIYTVNPTMGSNLIIVVFAVVVIGGRALRSRGTLFDFVHPHGQNGLFRAGDIALDMPSE